jgi:hypothetical protein
MKKSMEKFGVLKKVRTFASAFASKRGHKQKQKERVL